MRHEKLNDREWLEREYATGRSMRSIAAEIGCADSTVLYAIRRHGIAARRPGRAATTSRVPELLDGEWLEAAIATASHESVANSLGVSRRLVGYWLTRHRKAKTEAAPAGEA